jgi:hypothetical protein
VLRPASFNTATERRLTRELEDFPRWTRQLEGVFRTLVAEPAG